MPFIPGPLEGWYVGRVAILPATCYLCLLCSKHHAVHMQKGHLDLICLPFTYLPRYGFGFAAKRMSDTPYTLIVEPSTDRKVTEWRPVITQNTIPPLFQNGGDKS